MGKSDKSAETAVPGLAAGPRFDAGVLSERERCKTILREMRDAAEKRRAGHHAIPWLEHAWNAVNDGVVPGGEDA